VCVGERTIGGTVCFGEWTYVCNVVCVNGYMESMCVLVIGNMGLIWGW